MNDRFRLPLNTFIRVSSVLVVVAMSHSGPHDLFASFYVSFALAHYLIGFIYSRGRIARVIGQPQSRMPLLMLIVMGILITWNRAPAPFLYFGMHHALNETYVFHPPAEPRSSGSLKNLLASRFLLNFCVYFVLLRDCPLIKWVSPIIPLIGLTAAISLFLYFLKRAKASWEKNLLFDHLGFEFSGILLVFVSLFLKVTYHQVILYHVVSWIFLPLSRMRANDDEPAPRYLLLTAVITSAFFLLTPAGGAHFGIPLHRLMAQVDLWGYIHITASFALSSLNPAWIRRWFSSSERGIPDVTAATALVSAAGKAKEVVQVESPEAN